MTFAEMAGADCGLMLELFGEEHQVGGVTVTAIVHLDGVAPRELPAGGRRAWAGEGRAETVVYCLPSALPVTPAVGSRTTLDGAAMTVLEKGLEDGWLRLALEAYATPGTVQRCTVTRYAAGDGYSTPAVSATFANVPFRYLAQEQSAMDGGRHGVASAELAFAATCGISGLSAGDTVTIGAVVYRVLSVREDRGFGGELAEWVGSVSRV